VYEWKREPERSDSESLLHEVLPRAKDFSTFVWSNTLVVENSYYLGTLVEYLIGIPTWVVEDSNNPIPNLLKPPTDFIKNWTDIFQSSRSEPIWKAIPLLCAYIWRVTDQLKIDEQNQLLFAFVKSTIYRDFQNNLNDMTV
jgi:hypothetical protein